MPWDDQRRFHVCLKRREQFIINTSSVAMKSNCVYYATASVCLLLVQAVNELKTQVIFALRARKKHGADAAGTVWRRRKLGFCAASWRAGRN